MLPQSRAVARLGTAATLYPLLRPHSRPSGPDRCRDGAAALLRWLSLALFAVAGAAEPGASSGRPPARASLFGIQLPMYWIDRLGYKLRRFFLFRPPFLPLARPPAGSGRG